MTIAKLHKCYSNLRKQLKNGEISAEEAQERAVKLLADALDLKKSVEANSDDSYVLENLISWLDELTNIATVSL